MPLFSIPVTYFVLHYQHHLRSQPPTLFLIISIVFDRCHWPPSFLLPSSSIFCANFVRVVSTIVYPYWQPRPSSLFIAAGFHLLWFFTNYVVKGHVEIHSDTWSSYTKRVKSGLLMKTRFIVSCLCWACDTAFGDVRTAGEGAKCVHGSFVFWKEQCVPGHMTYLSLYVRVSIRTSHHHSIMWTFTSPVRTWKFDHAPPLRNTRKCWEDGARRQLADLVFLDGL